MKYINFNIIKIKNKNKKQKSNVNMMGFGIFSSLPTRPILFNFFKWNMFDKRGGSGWDSLVPNPLLSYLVVSVASPLSYWAMIEFF